MAITAVTDAALFSNATTLPCFKQSVLTGQAIGAAAAVISALGGNIMPLMKFDRILAAGAVLGVAATGLLNEVATDLMKVTTKYQSCITGCNGNWWCGAGCGLSAIGSGILELADSLLTAAIAVVPNLLTLTNGMFAASFAFMDDDCSLVTLGDLTNVITGNIGGTPFGTTANGNLYCLRHLYMFTFTPTPISLVWSNEITPAVVASAPFMKGADGDRWVIWKGSSSRPLVVYDPAKSGIIESPDQVFGEHALGRDWDNGFEALGSLDKNQDGVVDGDELADLSLWFDYNQNAVSDPGEVIDIRQAGVSELYHTIDQVDVDNGDLFASRGFKRIVDGQEVYGASLDWRSVVYSTREEGERILYSSYESKKENTLVPVAIANENPAKEDLRGLVGVWYYDLDKEFLTKDLYNITGMFAFLPNESGGISGVSVAETPLKENKDKLRSMQVRMPIYNVQVSRLDNGQQSVKFNVSDGTDSVIETRALISADGLTMTGSTSQESYREEKKKLKKMHFAYSWKASRAELPDEWTATTQDAPFGKSMKDAMERLKTEKPEEYSQRNAKMLEIGQKLEQVGEIKLKEFTPKSSQH